MLNRFSFVALIVFLGRGAAAGDPLELDRLLGNEGFAWTADSTRYFRVYSQAGSYADRRIDAVKRRLEEAHRRARHLLGTEEYTESIHVFYVESRHEMGQLVGRTPAGVANAFFHTAVLVYNENWRAFERHEIFHVLHENVWGTGAEPIHWFREGMAVYADGDCGGRAIETLARHAAEDGLLIPLRSLVYRPADNEELLWAVQGGAFFAFLHQAYGREKIRQLWKLGAAEVGSVLGKGWETLDGEFGRYLRAIPPGRPVDWGGLKRRGCG